MPSTAKGELEQFGQYPAPFAAVPPGLRICLFARSCTGDKRATAGCASRGLKVLRNRRIYEWRFIETDGWADGTNLFPFDVMGPILCLLSRTHSVPNLNKKEKPLIYNGFLVEHRRFELLTPTLPVLCATNCANAP